MIRVFVDQLQLYKCCHGNDVSNVPMGCADGSVKTQTRNIIIRPPKIVVIAIKEPRCAEEDLYDCNQ